VKSSPVLKNLFINQGKTPILTITAWLN